MDIAFAEQSVFMHSPIRGYSSGSLCMYSHRAYHLVAPLASPATSPVTYETKRRRNWSESNVTTVNTIRIVYVETNQTMVNGGGGGEWCHCCSISAYSWCTSSRRSLGRSRPSVFHSNPFMNLWGAGSVNLGPDRPPRGPQPNSRTRTIGLSWKEPKNLLRIFCNSLPTMYQIRAVSFDLQFGSLTPSKISLKSVHEFQRNRPLNSRVRMNRRGAPGAPELTREVRLRDIVAFGYMHIKIHCNRPVRCIVTTDGR
jgi:hypothetical protein